MKKVLLIIACIILIAILVLIIGVKNNMDKVKARRIIERIKHLTEDIEIISVNRRK